MTRMQQGVATVTPTLSSIAKEANDFTVVDLFNPEHPVNNKSLSGKRTGMAVIVDGHTWVAEGSNPSDGWYRNQKHIEEPTAILRTLDNTSVTSVTANSALVPTELDTLLPVETFFEGNWDIDSANGKITYTGVEAIIAFNVSGDYTTSDGSGTGDTVTIELLDSATGEGLTGATKTLNVAKVQGSNDSVIDFTLQGYARVTTGQYFQLLVGANFTGDLLSNNILLAAKPMDTLLYL